MDIRQAQIMAVETSIMDHITTSTLSPNSGQLWQIVGERWVIGHLHVASREWLENCAMYFRRIMLVMQALYVSV